MGESCCARLCIKPHLIAIHMHKTLQGRSLPKIQRTHLWGCGLCIYANDSKQGAFTNSVDPDAASGSGLFVILSTFLVIVDTIIRLYHECEGRIEKSVPRIAVWHHEVCRVRTNGDPKGRIFLSYPYTNKEFFFLAHHCFYFLFIYLFILR